MDVYIHELWKKVDLSKALTTLKELGINRLMVEGGATLNFELLRLGLVDEITAHIAPMIYGGKSAPTMASGSGLERSAAIPLKLVSVEKADDGGVLIKISCRDVNMTTTMHEKFDVCSKPRARSSL